MSWTTTASGPASSMICAVRAQIAGWVRASRSRSAAGSPKTTRPRAGRSRPPSRPSTAAPNRSATAASAGGAGLDDLARHGIGVDDDGARATRAGPTRSTCRSRSPGEAHAQHVGDPSAPRRRRQASGSARRAGKPPVATGPQRVGVIAQQRLALLDHRPAVLVPVGVLARDAAEVLDQRLDRVGRVDDLAVAVDLHPGAAEVVGEHEHADPRVAAGVGRLGPFRVGRDDDAALRRRRRR